MLTVSFAWLGRDGNLFWFTGFTMANLAGQKRPEDRDVQIKSVTAAVCRQNFRNRQPDSNLNHSRPEPLTTRAIYSAIC
jgi:hypothetical protein